MAIYIGSAILMLLGGMAFNANRRRKSYLIITFILLTMMFGMRDFSVGSDTITYCNEYILIGQRSIQTLLVQDRFEIGFLLLCKLLNCLSGDPRILLWVTGCLISGSVCRFIYKYSTDVSLSVYLWILLCLGDSFNLLRGYIALAVILFAFDYWLQNKRVPCFLCIAVGMSFHTVAIAALLPIILYSIFEKSGLRRAVIYVFLISLFALGLFPDLLTIVFLVFPQYSHYMSSVWGQANYFGTLIDVLPVIFVLILGAFYSVDRINSNKIRQEDFKFTFWQMSCALLFSMLAMRMTIFNRVTVLFYPYIINWIPMVLYRIKKDGERKLLWFIILVMVMAIFIVVSVFRPEWNNSVPYKFFWMT